MTATTPKAHIILKNMRAPKIRIFANPRRLADYVRYSLVVKNRDAEYGYAVGCYIDGEIYLLQAIAAKSIEPYSAEIDLNSLFPPYNTEPSYKTIFHRCDRVYVV